MGAAQPFTEDCPDFHGTKGLLPHRPPAVGRGNGLVALACRWRLAGDYCGASACSRKSFSQRAR
ncbi:MAG: hypothetical protein U1E05_06210, partial [Patescibacteria group bacterium]|nr:hypothetical protein [Patescibacteria group bacterium]